MKDLVGRTTGFPKVLCTPVTSQWSVQILYESRKVIFPLNLSTGIICMPVKAGLYRRISHLLLASHGDCGVDGVKALAEAVGVHGGGGVSLDGLDGLE